MQLWLRHVRDACEFIALRFARVMLDMHGKANVGTVRFESKQSISKACNCTNTLSRRYMRRTRPSQMIPPSPHRFLHVSVSMDWSNLCFASVVIE